MLVRKVERMFACLATLPWRALEVCSCMTGVATDVLISVTRTSSCARRVSYRVSKLHTRLKLFC